MKFRSLIILIYLVSLFWILFSIYWLFQGSNYRYFYAVTGFGFAVVLAIIAYHLNKKKRWAWWVALIMSIINIILTLTDQVGWFDLAYLVPSVVLLIMLLVVNSSLKSYSPSSPTMK
jgi:hypothetical protein